MLIITDWGTVKGDDIYEKNKFKDISIKDFLEKIDNGIGKEPNFFRKKYGISSYDDDPNGYSVWYKGELYHLELNSNVSKDIKNYIDELVEKQKEVDRIKKEADRIKEEVHLKKEYTKERIREQRKEYEEEVVRRCQKGKINTFEEKHLYIKDLKVEQISTYFFNIYKDVRAFPVWLHDKLDDHISGVYLPRFLTALVNIPLFMPTFMGNRLLRLVNYIKEPKIKEEIKRVENYYNNKVEEESLKEETENSINLALLKEKRETLIRHKLRREQQNKKQIFTEYLDISVESAKRLAKKVRDARDRYYNY